MRLHRYTGATSGFNRYRNDSSQSLKFTASFSDQVPFIDQVNQLFTPLSFRNSINK